MAADEIPMAFKIPIYFLLVIALTKITIKTVTDATTIPIAPKKFPKISKVTPISFKKAGWDSTAV